jgi:hypothetical protein
MVGALVVTFASARAALEDVLREVRPKTITPVEQLDEHTVAVDVYVSPLTGPLNFMLPLVLEKLRVKVLPFLDPDIGSEPLELLVPIDPETLPALSIRSNQT